LFIPWTSAVYHHTFLVVAHTVYTAPSEGPSNSLSLPVLQIYNSEPDLISPEHHKRIMWEIRQAIQRLAWYQGPGVALTEDLHWMPLQAPPTARQREGDGLSCGHHTILNAWTLLLKPLQINPDFAADGGFYVYASNVINLAIGGHIGLHTIARFLVCTKFATIPDDNALVDVFFAKTMRIQDDAVLDAYYQEALARENELWETSRIESAVPPDIQSHDIDVMSLAEMERQMAESGWPCEGDVRTEYEAFQNFVMSMLQEKGD